MTRVAAARDVLVGGAMALRVLARGLLAPRRARVTLSERLGHIAATLPVREPVLIHWNAQQIPFIEARNDDDLAVGLGAVHAHLRLAQMEILRRLAAGRVAETIGPLGLPLDRTLRLFDFGRAVPAIIERLSDPTRRWAEGFIAGVNHQMAHGPAPEEFRHLGMAAEPWTLTDLFTTARLASADVSWIVWSRLLRVRSRLSPAVWKEIWPELLGDQEPEPTGVEPLTLATRVGSNAAVVGGRRTRSGAGMLAADPHLSTALPNIWLAAGLSSPGINAVGIMPAAFPVIAIGRNRWLTWGGTSLHAASSELFDASDLPLREREVEIKVRGHKPRRVTLRESDLGPIVSDGMILRNRSPTALCWVGHQPSDEMGAMLSVMRAHSAEEFRSALADFAIPAQNMVHAGRDGRVGHLLAASLPRRPNGPPPDLVMPPDAHQAWDRMVRTPELPHWLDPPAGFAVSANDRPPPGDVPVGFFFSANDRADRMRELLEANAAVDLSALGALQNDVLGRNSMRVCESLLARLTPAEAAHPVIRALATWDGRYSADSRGALAYEALIATLVWRLGTKERRTSLSTIWTGRLRLMREVAAAPDAAMRRALALTVPRTARVLRRLRMWGGAHRLALRHQLAALPVIGWRYRFGTLPGGGSNETLNKTGHALTARRHHVTFGASARFIADMGDLDANRVVLLGGQDGWLGSDTFLDQVPLWQRGEYVDLPLRREAARMWPHHTVHAPPTLR
ncbi:MAG TPA: penicillin acylase family protein [Acetobacteraceae bacterium]|nr:penicillin acylase family protein [Acetobacteraceae bacterium]